MTFWRRILSPADRPIVDDPPRSSRLSRGSASEPKSISTCSVVARHLVSILFARRSMGEPARREDLAQQTIRVSIRGGISFAETVHVDARQALPLFARLKLALHFPSNANPLARKTRSQVRRLRVL